MDKAKMDIPNRLVPVLAAAVEAGGQIVAARVAQGGTYSLSTAEDFGQDVQAIAGQIMRALLA